MSDLTSLESYWTRRKAAASEVEEIAESFRDSSDERTVLAVMMLDEVIAMLRGETPLD